jgi:hypothetical protein
MVPAVPVRITRPTAVEGLLYDKLKTWVNRSQKPPSPGRLARLLRLLAVAADLVGGLQVAGQRRGQAPRRAR